MPIDHNLSPVPIVILVDVEPDEFFINRSSSNTWHGCESAFSTLIEARAKLEQATGRPVHFTWSIRADPQIAESYGSPGWILQQYRQILEQLRVQGDEIGIHVHAYHWNESLNNWIEDYGDQAWVEHCVRMSVAAYQQEYGHPPKIFSMGADWINNETVHLLRDLGIQCDTTVVAGRPTRPFPTELGAYTGTRTDWSAIGPHPYHPLEQDFRLPALGQSDDELWILPLLAHTVERQLSWRRKLLQFLPGSFAKKPSTRTEKIFLNSGVMSIRRQLEKILNGSDESYLTLIVGARSFAEGNRGKSILDTLEFFANYEFATQCTFATPLEAVQIVNQQEYVA